MTMCMIYNVLQIHTACYIYIMMMILQRDYKETQQNINQTIYKKKYAINTLCSRGVVVVVVVVVIYFICWIFSIVFIKLSDIYFITLFYLFYFYIFLCVVCRFSARHDFLFTLVWVSLHNFYIQTKLQINY